MNNAFAPEGGASANATIDARVDTGTIAWLLPEIIHAFDAATAALRQFRAGAAGVERADVDLAPLRVARSHLHQAHGALELSEIAGVTKVSEAIEELAALFESEPGHCDATALDAILGGCRTIVEYLEDLQGGARQQPLYLFPSYRDLLAARGVDRIHPADLFLVDLAIRAPRSDDGESLDAASLYEQRAQFEQALLRYIRDETDLKALSRLCRAVTSIDGSVAKTATGGQGQQRAFWWATRALFEALSNDGFAKSKSQHAYLKRVAGRVNLQIRRLAEGSNAVAERLFADVLFFVAISAPVTQHVRDVQTRFGLVGAVPDDFEVQRYGRIDPAVLKVARDALTAAKSAWSAVVGGDVKHIHEFAKQTTSLHDAMGAIGRRGLAQVAQVIDGIATDLGFDPRQPPAAVGLDVATALLFLEGALDRARLLDDAFDQRAALVVARLEASALGQEQTTSSVDWLDRMAREADERITTATFVAELQANLRSAEKDLDAFFREPAERAGLKTAQAALAQVSGALALLGHTDVHRAIDQARAKITEFQEASSTDSAAFEELAQNLGAVGFYVEQIKRDRIDPRAFHYDPASGRFSVEFARPAPAGESRAEADEAVVPAPERFEEPVSAPAAQAPEPVEISPIAFAATEILDTDATLEDEIANRASDAQAHAMRLRDEPDDRAIRDALAAAVDDVRRNAALIDDRALQDEAATVLASLRQAGDAPLVAAAVTQIVDRVVALVAQARRSVGIAAPSALPAEPVVAVPSEENVEAIDAELLEIFLEEAGTVLVDAEASLRVLDADPINTTATVNLRRNFHTLKGSSRMVGLMAFGEAAWAIEDTLNGHIADQVEASSDLRALIEYAARYLSAWVDELRQTGTSPRNPDALIEAARALRSGATPFEMSFAATEVIDLAPVAEPPMLVDETPPMVEPEAAFEAAAPELRDTPTEHDALPMFESIDFESEATPAEPVAVEAPEAPVVVDVTESPVAVEAPVMLDWLDFPSDSAEPPAPTVDVADIEPVAAIDEPLTIDEPFGATDEPLTIDEPFAAIDEPRVDIVEEPVEEEIVFEAVEPAPVVETVAPPGDDVRRIGHLTLSMPLFNIYLAEADELLRVLTQDFAEWSHELDRFVSENAMRAAHSLAGSSSTVGLVPAHDLAAGIEDVLLALYREPIIMSPEQVTHLQDAVESLRRMLHRFAAERLPDPDPEVLAGLVALKREILGPDRRPAAEVPEAGPAPVSDALQIAHEANDIEEFDVFGEEPAVDPVATAPEAVPEIEVIDMPVGDEQPVESFVDETASVVEADEGGWFAEEPPAPVEQEPETVDAHERPFEQEPETVTVHERPFEQEPETVDVREQPVEQEPETVTGHEQPLEQERETVDAHEQRFEQEPETVDVHEQPLVQQHETVDVHEQPLVQQPEIVDVHEQPLEQEPDTVDVHEQRLEREPETVDVHEQPFDAEPDDAEAEEIAIENAFAMLTSDESSVLMRRAVPIPVESAVKDDIDPDLLDVFVEEGSEILPQIATLLRTWQAHRDNPAPSRMLLRHLHTLKGSARMAGAMRLGEVVHDMEARVEAAAKLPEVPASVVDELLAVHDRSLELFDRLQHPQAAAAEAVEEAAVDASVATDVESVSEVVAGTVDTIAPLAADVPVAATAPVRGREQKPTTQAVRVNSETLDRLVNLAGEVSISRARIENEVLQIKGAMGELSDNVERLRSQLREIELQAEFQMQSQMQSQQAAGHEREKFDPLEFDRFTRFQELTRMMAESVNDVKTVQQHLQKSLESAEVDLTSQRRMTRDLQQDLMAVRMVPFSSIAERLYRVARRASKEVDKRVNLDIRGGTVEIDRSVLERMAGPFEHLLRNHIVHGIESREVRRSHDKAETGELLVEIRQEGNEIVLTFSDDGAGLNYDRIRAKGREAGLIGDQPVTDAQAAELIFSPGFSTAAEVTELAGRGVGMDVVREEVIGLAGRISIDSEADKGTRFTINLPLTLAVTQVVLVSVAERIYALPSVLVEQVQQLRPQALADAYRAERLEWDGMNVRLAFLGSLLGIEDIVPVAQRTSPVLMLRSAGERLAVHVDAVIGNQEVVVKNLGPQLARMAGIAGATVLGSGEIVLILNPVQLAHLVRSEAIRPQVLPAADAVEAASEAGLKTLPTVMVVDDSLTVRRVTQRLLSREGYQVVLAKDGVDALEQLQDFPPDVMLVDIEMPRMDGFDLTRNVRNDERYRHIPIIMITSRTAEKHRRHAADLGVDAYLGKPYQEDELLDLLRMHVKESRGHPA